MDRSQPIALNVIKIQYLIIFGKINVFQNVQIQLSNNN
jgi:hypothetical protein